MMFKYVAILGTYVFLLYGFAYPATLVVDDFDNDFQYNTTHTNDLGGYSDDDGTLKSDTVLSNFIRLAWTNTKLNAGTNCYWYSVLSKLPALPYFDATDYNYLKIHLRKKNGDENFFIQLTDISEQKYQLAINYFSRIAVDTNNFSIYLIPLQYFKFVNLSILKDIVLQFSVPFASLSSTATIEIDEISFISTNYQYSPGVITPYLIADFENSLWHTKQGGYFAIESDTNSFARPAYSNSVVTSVNYTPYGKYCLEWEYNLYNWDYAYSACYWTVAPDGYYADISDYNKLSFYVKADSYNPYYKFQLKDKSGNSAERLFSATLFWKKIEFNLEEMALQSGVDLNNISSFAITIKQPGLSDKLYIDDVYLISDSTSMWVPENKNRFIQFQIDKKMVLNTDDKIDYIIRSLEDCKIRISIYSREGIELIKVLDETQLLKNYIFTSSIDEFSDIKNGVYILRVEAENSSSTEIINKVIMVAR